MSAAVKSRAVAGTDGSGKKKKKKFNRLLLLIPLGLIVAVVMWGFVPMQGSIRYGVCKTFIEKRTSYPLYLDIATVQERPNDVRLEYTIVNEFGDTLFNTVTCVFRPDAVTGFALSDVILNRRKIEEKELIPFNATIPAIITNPPNLILPAPKSGELIDLWVPPNYE